MESRRKKVLLLTASFGEGHNTAAKSVAQAISFLPGQPAEAQIFDVYSRATPHLNKAVQTGYRLAINRATTIWKAIFLILDRPGMLEKSMPLVGKMRDVLARAIQEYRPDVLVSTYPLYSFLVKEIAKRTQEKLPPLATIITDSCAVNSAWYRCESDLLIVADEATRERLINQGVREELIRVMGFPVNPHFETLKPLGDEVPERWRILFMPSTSVSGGLRSISSLLSAADCEITVLTGRNKRCYQNLTAQNPDPSRCKVLGWTDQMPELLATHHLFVGKAGGAIVQECVAAQCPLLISHVVPGQEEGNLGLVLQHQVGALANTPSLLREQASLAFENGAERWRLWKAHMRQISRPDASRRIAEFLMTLTS